ncbi:BlaI/MecI/CopY family transcriptional regulator [Sphingosinicella sp. LY1275]|uniref:BlaI/MecI/CopY family transcriptional regulator n=1 Tax=Sphingosinicella sp. LY1275 TaxID=3095379 RepID=UPI002ADEB1B7|nr:BlaI/MecI/CopY family transcriptional regulator [Sphingosinicella sp. LY1275]MEA1013854.1 BlaI/MecI/CopY family transcriptional regulator [Sphingosinicella sp. LY1275]
MGRATRIEWLPPRERQIAEIVLQHGSLSASEIMASIGTPLTNSAVRSMLRRLEAKGVLRHHKRGKCFLYEPAAPDEEACRRALREVSETYFGASLCDAVEVLLAMVEAQNPAEAGRLRERLANGTAREH